MDKRVSCHHLRSPTSVHSIPPVCLSVQREYVIAPWNAGQQRDSSPRRERELRLGIGRLGGAPGTGTASTTAALAGEASTATTLAAGPSTLKSTTSPSRDAASSGVVVGSAVRAGLRSSRLDNNVLSVHDVRVGGSRSLVTGG